jgi:2-polyprenyl-3-methyl-5-hydroxy-6-metoxy-1,4-benzoquinol methylase
MPSPASLGRTASPKCCVCGTQMVLKFEAQFIQHHTAALHLCPNCEFLCASRVTWLDEAYSDAIAVTDTGIALRNWATAETLHLFAYFAGLRDKRGLDLGGGHGLLVRILRDFGLDFRWSDLHAENIFARGCEDDGGPYDWLTMIEVFEHLENPRAFLEDAISRYSPRSIVFTTLPRPELVPDRSWWYWSFETGQHISFVTQKTLQTLASDLEFEIVSHGMFHLLTRQRRHAAAFRVATSRVKRILGPVLRFRGPSLTMDDHRRLVKLIRGS